MVRISILALAAGMIGSTAFAAGIERNAPSSRVLFEDGRYLEFAMRYVSPDLSGNAGPGAPTGNLLESYASFGFAYKADLTDRLSYALILDEPWGVDTLYQGGAPYTGVDAELNSRELTGILAFDLGERVKVYGGLRVQQTEAAAAIPFVGGYTIETDKQTDLGYLVGAAYQIPEIALRVAATYYSPIKHTLNSTEFNAFDDQTVVETPEAVNLEFQSGIAKDTLIFGSIRWVNWSDFAIAPPNYPLGTLVDYEKDWTNYTLGVGRKFNDTWSGFIQASHEPASKTVLTTLGPIDGRSSLGIGATYTKDNVKITGGVTYSWLGDAENVLATQFDDGSAIGIGVRVGYTF